MSQPLAAPSSPRPRPKRRVPAWVVRLATALFVCVLILAGYVVGTHAQPVPLWDELRLRAWMNRPLDTSDPGTGFWVSGYYVDYDRSSLDVVKTRSTHMDQVVIFGYGFDKEGTLIGKEQELVKGLTGPQKRILLFGNLTDGGFNAQTAHAILTDPTVQAKAVKAMLEKSTLLQVAGLQIDFENIPDGDRQAYTAFLQRLKDDLTPHNMTLSIAAAAKTRDTTTGWGGATDYVAIGRIVDQFYIMAYDEHYLGGEPGPVASLPWVERVVRYATGVMPAQKVVLGVPFYGYDWAVQPQPGGAGNKAYGSMRMAERMTDLGATVKWDPVVSENVATYKGTDGERVVWYPDQRSLDAKLKLAYQYNLRGIAIWRFGFEPDPWWDQLAAFRVSPTK